MIHYVRERGHTDFIGFFVAALKDNTISAFTVDTEYLVLVHGRKRKGTGRRRVKLKVEEIDRQTGRQTGTPKIQAAAASKRKKNIGQ